MVLQLPAAKMHWVLTVLAVILALIGVAGAVGVYFT
jgi:hypothetical protein